MRIGKLRHRLRIERPSNVSDGAGGEVTIWSRLATVWAEILATGGGKDLEGTVVAIGQQRYRIHVRYRSDITTDCRLVWERDSGDTDLRLDSLADIDGRRRILLIMATDGVPT